ncbi:iron uptake protein [Stenotrophomonas sp. ATCM1_4]|uniref:iron uptake protein n=1 Tax=Stenotrophomonas sp. ATCM1_4 TaxID=2259330 RepID=UPI0010430B88|nr:iron uptake protein [Stenotrophomonas sp. ATCM1_4]TDB27438.1 iron uptake protein [Stenotrophomonas sp. ATCM1_4]
MPQVSTASAPPPASRRLQVLPRILAAILGGYVFAWGTVALTTSALFALKLAFHDAEFLGALVGLLAYLGVFLWAIATHHVARLWMALVGGGALMAAAASLLQSRLV